MTMTESVGRLTRDLVISAKTLSDDEARFLVDYYYLCQEDRKRASNQTRALTKDGEPCAVVSWLADQSTVLEGQIKRALDAYTDAHPMGEWLKGLYGIGPVIAAGLLAHIDIKKAPTAGHIWSYAGLNPTSNWISSEKSHAWVKDNGVDVGAAAAAFNRNYESLRYMASRDAKGKEVKITATSLARAISRRPWNASLKTLCWKIGQSFMKFSGQEECYYGQIYKERKAYEVARNENGTNRELALSLAPKFKPTTEARAHLEGGKLPPAQIDARARRYAVKLFLSHMQEVWYEKEFGVKPPLPYAIAFGGHAHKIDPPVSKPH